MGATDRDENLPPASSGPSDDEETIMHLERDQLVVDRQLPVPRTQLSTRAQAALWALRVFVLVVSAMVMYAFISQLA
ncbi:MAG: hypothetical protein ACP5H2_03105 [Solirubrobacteraceae bacterium]